MKCSVVMATYNGSKYLIDQLNSILNQTRQPDEVIIVDDCSIDDTVDLVMTYIEKHGLSNSWRLMVNTSNKGVTQNFLDAALTASSDIIFFSDQDDVWEIAKIEEMMEGFESIQDMQACYCLRTYTNENGEPLSKLFEHFVNVPVKNPNGFQRVSLIEAVKYNKSPGLCLGLRKELVAELRPLILNNGLTHDLPVGTVAAIKDGYYVLNQRLVRYRIHQDNVSAPRVTIAGRVTALDRQIEGRASRYQQMNVILREYGNKLDERDFRLLSDATVQTAISVDLLRKRDIPGLIKQLFHRNRMMSPWIALNNLLCVVVNMGKK